MSVHRVWGVNIYCLASGEEVVRVDLPVFSVTECQTLWGLEMNKLCAIVGVSWGKLARYSCRGFRYVETALYAG